LIPAVRAFNYVRHEGLYYSLMMSTGLTFGTIAALFGINHGIINQTQYSHLVATVIGSAVVPTAIANAHFLPKHLLPKSAEPLETFIEGEHSSTPAVNPIKAPRSAQG
jgi:glutathione-regulated potassium-efflux system ancillary protein KefC